MITGIGRIDVEIGPSLAQCLPDTLAVTPSCRRMLLRTGWVDDRCMELALGTPLSMAHIGEVAVVANGELSCAGG